MRRIIVCEFAPERGSAFMNWLPGSRVVRRYLGETVPESFDVLMLGGGPMSANEEDRARHPFIQEEFDRVRALASDPAAPMLVGICLGAQLIVLALGGDVVRGETVRGWNEIRQLADHRMFPLCTRYVQFEFHSNHIVRLPPGARLLADSPRDAVEAFAVGDRILATAYHPEIGPADAERIYRGAGLAPSELHNDRFPDPGPAAAFASRFFFDAITA
ncbi:type 1 glutamine amidotransferase [Candidatus Uhrbacteria bacterium]|nr:type 1 glutamine amidotransferase [Candidatus Uhrbacteria bacterium]